MKISGFSKLAEEEESLRAALAKQPVAVAVTLSTVLLQFYSSGTVDGRAECSGNIEGMGGERKLNLLAVGFDHERYKLKASWGDDWGDGGYLYIELGSNVGGVSDHAYAPHGVEVSGRTLKPPPKAAAATAAAREKSEEAQKVLEARAARQALAARQAEEAAAMAAAAPASEASMAGFGGTNER